MADTTKVTLHSLYDDWDDLAPLTTTLSQYLATKEAYRAVQNIAEDEDAHVNVTTPRLQEFIDEMREFDIEVKPSTVVK